MIRHINETDAQLRDRLKGLYSIQLDKADLDALGLLTLIIQVGPVKPALTPEMLREKTKQRFGRVARDLGLLGELRKQKKEPHTEVLYVWAPPAQAYELDKKGNQIASPSIVLRSVSNLSNDDLTNVIRQVGQMTEAQSVDRSDAEFVLDMLYADLQRRQDWTDREKAKRNA